MGWMHRHDLESKVKSDGYIDEVWNSKWRVIVALAEHTQHECHWFTSSIRIHLHFLISVQFYCPTAILLSLINPQIVILSLRQFPII
jgi:hypothetical protein